jgi:peroxiredoxin
MVRRIAGAIAALVVAAAAVFAFLYLRGRESTALRVGDTVPDVELPAVEGGARARLRDNLGPATVVVFMDTRWPAMQRYAQLLERTNRRYTRQRFRMVAIAVDDSADAVREFIRANAITFTVLHDPGGRATAAGFGPVRGPTAYLTDGAGRVVAAFPDPVDWRRDEHRARIEALLPSPPPGW